MARPMKWSMVARTLGWVVALSFLLAALLTVFLAVDVLGPAPERGDDFIAYALELFAWESERWVLDFPASALFALGFLALAGLGAVLARLAFLSEARQSLIASSFLVGGSLGAISQLLWIGAIPVATSTQYCDCGFLQEEIMSRLMILNVVRGIQTWLISGALLVLAVGALLLATMPERQGVARWWRQLTLLIGFLSIVGVILPWFDVYPFDVLLVLLISGVLIPIWAIWIANRPPDLWDHEGIRAG